MPENNATLVKIDKTDRKILEQVQNNGALTNQELADKVGLSPSPCLRRVRALEEAGVIVRPSLSWITRNWDCRSPPSS